MQLRIGVDAWNLRGDRRGSGRYVREILRRWVSWPKRVDVTLLVPERIPLIVRDMYQREAGAPGLLVKNRGAVNELGLNAVWYPWNGMSWIAPCTSVATLHDASLFAMPPEDDAIALREQRPFRTAAEHAQRIVTDSQFAKGDLIRYLQLDPAIVEVIHLGVDPEKFNRKIGALQTDTPPKYVLFVGEPEQRKGLATLLAAMALLPGEMRAITQLVIAGSTGRYPMPATPEGVSLQNLGHVEDEHLAKLYGNAGVFVYPSEYEGFGLPVLEAMACGTPVVASDIPSVREAGGDAAVYVRARDPAALADAIVRVFTDPRLADELREKGARRTQNMTWETVAEETLAVLSRAAGERSAGG